MTHRTHYTAGERITIPVSFTSPIGCWFSAGSTFIVEIGGETGGRSIKLRAERCGSVVWISDGVLLVAEEPNR